MQPDPPAAAEALVRHAEAVCDSVDHLWRLLGQLSIPTELLTDTRDDWKVTYQTEQMARAFLYADIRNLSQNELADRLSTRPALCNQFGFDDPPRQQTLSETWRAFSPETQRVLDHAAVGIAHAAHEHDVIHEALVPTSPEEPTDTEPSKDERAWKREKASKTIELARRHAFPVFDSGRAANRTYEDETILEMVARMCSHRASAHAEGEHGWLTDDDATASGSTILRVLKQFATPTDEDAQLTVDELLADDTLPQIDRTRDAVMSAFDAATENIINSIRGDDPFDDRHTVAAIDITHEPFYASPWLDKDEGRVKADYPAMVSGYKHGDTYERGYKYATITLVGECAPIILGVEPVKEHSAWEDDDAVSYSKGDIVGRLLDRAQAVVDVDEVMLDRGFYSHDVAAAIDDRELTYLMPKPTYTDDYESIENIQEHPTADAAVEHAVPFYATGESHHSAEFLYVPSTSDDAEGTYAVFVTNRERVAPDDIDAVSNRYGRRWDIENQYKSMKQFLPRTSSTDYRLRLCTFVLTALIYNLWRLTDYLIKTGMDRKVRSSPVLSAQTFVRALGEFLRVGG